MAHRAHLFSLRIGHALREACFSDEPYSVGRLRGDVLAGIAITVGVLLACILFVSEMAAMTKITDITNNKKLIDADIPDRWAVLKINGPLFFAAADRVFGEIAAKMTARDGVILYMDGVTLLDAGGVAAMNKLIDYCAAQGKQVSITDLQFQPLKTLARAEVAPRKGVSVFYSTLDEAIHQFN